MNGSTSRSSTSRVDCGCTEAWIIRLVRFLNDMWSSSDGVTWSKIGHTRAWSPRGSQTVVVYHDRLWLFGGANHVAGDRSTDGFLNDVWVSDDGNTWTQVTPAAPWTPRDKAGVVVFQGGLYLLGGQDTADVWRSSNGRDWTPLVAEADWGATPRLCPGRVRRQALGVRRLERPLHRCPQ